MHGKNTIGSSPGSVMTVKALCKGIAPGKCLLEDTVHSIAELYEA